MNIKKQPSEHGTLSMEYAEGRNHNKALKYRLERRTLEVKNAIKQHLNQDPKSIIDLGTADGKMLNEIKKTYLNSECIGIEYDEKLVNYAKELFPDLIIKKGDVQELYEFSADRFDVAIATAVIEHVIDPQKFINEVKRIMKPNGILIITAPDPIWELIATKIGHLAQEQHNEVPNIKRIVQIVSAAGLNVIETKKFMISPVGMPFEIQIEKFLRTLRADFLMANQLVVSKK